MNFTFIWLLFVGFSFCFSIFCCVDFALFDFLFYFVFAEDRENEIECIISEQILKELEEIKAYDANIWEIS